jgi:peptidoglycan/LPS O-acetylase OafA/YrhL
VPDGAAPAPFYGFPVLYVGWSLNYEMMFYAVALAALLLRQGIYALVAALLVMVLAGPYFESIMTSRLIWEFIFGIGAAWIFTRTARINAPTWAYSALAGAAVLVFFVAQMSTSVHFSLIHRGLSSAFLVYALVEAERRGALQFGKFSEWAGSQSYALYLTHPFIVVYAQYHWFLPPKQPHLTALAYVVLPAVSLALTALIHRRVELPIVQFGIRLSHATTANKAARLRRTDGELRESRQVGGTR